MQFYSFVAKQVLDLHKELEDAHKTGADKQQIYQKYTVISETNRAQAAAAECVNNPFCASGALAEVEAGDSIAKTLGRLSLFSSLPNEDRSEFCRFVFSENQETAGAIYAAMPGYVKAALSAQEAAQAVGLGTVVGGKPLAALGVKPRKPPYEPNRGAANNMGEFFKQPGFGSEMAKNSRRTEKTYQGQTIHKATDDIGNNINEGDKFYLDAKHKNHLEVFDGNRKIKAVLNLDGTYNEDKTMKARAEGRRLDK
jgi:filamentous hemagglutinin